jgi:hypothetical protein
MCEVSGAVQNGEAEMQSSIMVDLIPSTNPTNEEHEIRLRYRRHLNTTNCRRIDVRMLTRSSCPGIVQYMGANIS